MKHRFKLSNMKNISGNLTIIYASILALMIGIIIGASLNRGDCVDISKQYKNENYTYCWSKVYHTGDRADYVCFTFRGINYCRAVD